MRGKALLRRKASTNAWNDKPMWRRNVLDPYQSWRLRQGAIKLWVTKLSPLLHLYHKNSYKYCKCLKLKWLIYMRKKCFRFILMLQVISERPNQHYKSHGWRNHPLCCSWITRTPIMTTNAWNDKRLWQEEYSKPKLNVSSRRHSKFIAAIVTEHFPCSLDFY